MKLIDLVDILRGDLSAIAPRRQFMNEADFEQVLNALSEGDAKARKIIDEVIVQLGKRGVHGENMLFALAAFHKLGFRGPAVVQAFEANHFCFERTYYRGVFAVIRSEFPFIKDPFAENTPLSSHDPAPQPSPEAE